MLESILFKYSIPPENHADFRLLIDEGKVESFEFSERLYSWRSFKACLREALAAMSQPYAHMFGAPVKSA